MIITISGQAGSGKTTVGKLLAKRLGYDFYDIGTLRKIAAQKRGMAIEEYNDYGLTHPETDKDADAETMKLSKEKKDFVIQGRLAYHFIPESFKVYLTIDPDVAAKRLSIDTNPSAERNSRSKTSCVDEIRKMTIARDEDDKLRYSRIYGIKDFTEPKNYDLILDTSKMTPEQVADRILDRAGVKKKVSQ